MWWIYQDTAWETNIMIKDNICLIGLWWCTLCNMFGIYYLICHGDFLKMLINDMISYITHISGSFVLLAYLFYKCCKYYYRAWCNPIFLAATKQLYKWYFPSVCPSVRPSVCPSVCHTFLTMFPSSYHHEIFRSYYQLPKVRSVQKVKVRGQRSRSQRSQPNLAISGL